MGGLFLRGILRHLLGKTCVSPFEYFPRGVGNGYPLHKSIPSSRSRRVGGFIRPRAGMSGFVRLERDHIQSIYSAID